MDRNLRYSALDLRAAPSAIFDGTLTADRLVWAVKPKRSDAGNPLVIR
jgi:hypothetical protein